MRTVVLMSYNPLAVLEVSEDVIRVWEQEGTRILRYDSPIAMWGSFSKSEFPVQGIVGVVATAAFISGLGDDVIVLHIASNDTDIIPDIMHQIVNLADNIKYVRIKPTPQFYGPSVNFNIDKELLEILE